MEQSFFVKNKWLMALLGAVVVGFMLWYFSTIVFYILGAAAVSFIGGPLVVLIERLQIKGRNLPRWIAAMIALLVLLGLFLLGVWLIVPTIIDKVNYLAQADTTQITANITEVSQRINEWLRANFPMSDLTVRDLYEQYASPYVSSVSVGGAVSGVATFLVDFGVAIFSISFISFFFLKDERLFGHGIVMLFPKRYEENVQRGLASSVNLLGRYFVGIFCESLIKFLVVCFALYFCGLEFQTSMIIGLVTGVLNVIPYIGPIMGWAISLLIVAFSPDTASLGTELLFTSVVLLVFQLLDNIVLQPYIYSSSVKAHPLEIFLVILMAGYIGGIVGMLVAIPCYTLLRVFAKEFFANLRVVQKLTENL